MLTEGEKELVRQLQEDLPLVERPYAEIGERAGMGEDAVIETILRWKDEGTIRRLGAVIAHERAGIGVNAMVVWSVPSEHAGEVGELMATFPQVSHCYERPSSAEWPFNLYTMVHATSQAECEQIVMDLSEATGMEDYRVLYTLRELKKESMRYFPHEHRAGN